MMLQGSEAPGSQCLSSIPAGLQTPSQAPPLLPSLSDARSAKPPRRICTPQCRLWDPAGEAKESSGSEDLADNAYNERHRQSADWEQQRYEDYFANHEANPFRKAPRRKGGGRGPADHQRSASFSEGDEEPPPQPVRLSGAVVNALLTLEGRPSSTPESAVVGPPPPRVPANPLRVVLFRKRKAKEEAEGGAPIVPRASEPRAHA